MKKKIQEVGRDSMCLYAGHVSSQVDNFERLLFYNCSECNGVSDRSIGIQVGQHESSTVLLHNPMPVVSFPCPCQQITTRTHLAVM